mgnify:CR=1 FL=1
MPLPSAHLAFKRGLDSLDAGIISASSNPLNGTLTLSLGWEDSCLLSLRLTGTTAPAAVTGRIAAELEALSDAGTIRVIDARFLVKESEDEVAAVRASDLDDEERAELRAAAGALAIHLGPLLPDVGGFVPLEAPAVVEVEGLELVLAAASLGHRNVVQVSDLCLEPGGTALLVMELLEGETLAERLRRGPLPLDEAVDIATQTGDALQAAHDTDQHHVRETDHVGPLALGQAWATATLRLSRPLRHRRRSTPSRS